MALSLSPSTAGAISESTVFLDYDSSSQNLPQLSKQLPSKNNDSIVLSPWLGNEPPFLNRVWMKPKKSDHKPRSIITCPTREKIMPRSLQICHEEYKMNRTFLQFRIKASNDSLAKKRSHSDKTESPFSQSPDKTAIGRKNITAFTISAEKSPKMKFLERKLRLKESLVSSLRRKKRMQGMKEGQADHFDIAFANFHEMTEERDNLTSLKFRKAAKGRQEFMKWHSNEVLTIQ